MHISSESSRYFLFALFCKPEINLVQPRRDKVSRTEFSELNEYAKPCRNACSTKLIQDYPPAIWANAVLL